MDTFINLVITIWVALFAIRILEQLTKTENGEGLLAPMFNRNPGYILIFGIILILNFICTLIIILSLIWV